jgi:hypothetical protein
MMQMMLLMFDAADVEVVNAALVLVSGQVAMLSVPADKLGMLIGPLSAAAAAAYLAPVLLCGMFMGVW